MRPFLLPLSWLLLAAASILQAQTASIRVANPMDFGTLAVDGRGGMVNLTELGVLIPVGPGVRSGGAGPPSQARLILQGKPGAPFTLTLDPATPVLTGPHGARITMQSFNVLPAALSGSLGVDGQGAVSVGGRLDFPSALPPGTYTTSVRLQMSTQGPRGPLLVTQPFLVTARIQASLRLVCLQGLDFGDVFRGSVPGSLEVSPGGSYQSVPPAGPVPMKRAPRPAKFLLQGPAGTDYSIQVPSQIQLNGPGNAIVVRDFTLDTPARGILPFGGKPFALGASAIVLPDQAAGSYQGILQVTVFYP